MKLRIAIQDRTHLVTIPETLSPGVPLVVQVDDRPPLTAIWHGRHGVLSFLESAPSPANPLQLETNLMVRSQSVTRHDDDQGQEVRAEIRSGAVNCVKATVVPDLPGQANRGHKAQSDQSVVRSPMTGKILKVMVKAGDIVQPGDPLAIIEAMKMENKIFSAVAGTVVTVPIKVGDAVQTGRDLVRIKL